MIDWPAALDRYEASLGHHQQLVEAESADGQNPWPPSELPVGPVPDHLRERAASLVQRSNKIIDDMAAKMADIPPRKPARYSSRATRELPRWSKTL